MDCSLPGSSVYGILQARIVGWVAISYSRGSSRPRDQNWVSCIAGRFFIYEGSFSNTWTMNFQMFKLVLEKPEEPEKAEEPEIK